jgi:hypothetical protein
MKILAYDYQIKGLSNPVETATLFGRHDSNSLTITICTGMQRQHQESTMIHEVFEAINWQLKIGLEEQQIICLEAGLYHVLRNAGVNLDPLMKELDATKSA